MITAGQFNISVNRWVPNSLSMAFPGIDFTGATATLQVRDYRDASGSPRLSLSMGSGLSLSVTSSGGIPTSTITAAFGETDIEGLPFTAPIGGDLALVYDLVIDGGGFGKVRWLEGDFIVRAGVTQ